MKKKLLITLLSLFMMISTFTVSVFADINTVGDVLSTNTDFPTDQTKGWVNSNGKKAYKGLMGVQIGANIVFVNQPVSGSGKTYTYDSGSGVVATFNLDDGGKLASIELSNSSDPDSNGIYYPPVPTVADILPNDFPTSKRRAWKHNDKNAYINDTNLKIGSYSVPLTNVVSGSGNKYSTEVSGVDIYPCTVAFNFDNNDKLVSIVFSGGNLDPDSNGTYTAPLTIAYILPDDFPSTDTATVPNDAWVKSGNIKIKSYIENNSLHIGDDFIGLNTSVTKVNDNTYTNAGSSNLSGTITFNFENGELVSITHAGGSTSSINGTYAPITIADILPADFPTSNGLSNVPVGAWIKSSGSKLFISTEITKSLVVSDSGASFPLASKLTYESQNKYKYNSGMFGNIHFTIDNNKLISIEIDSCIYYPYVNGTYTAPPTIADILPDDFPTTVESGWVDQNGTRMYADVSVLKTNSNYEVPLNSVLTLEGDNYSFELLSNKYTFVMQSGVLNKIDVTVIFATNSYSPYAYTNPSISEPEGYSGDVEFVTNGKYVDQSTTPVTVKVDNTPLTYGTQYEVTTGSTHVKLKGSYISTLAIGTHTIEVGMTGYNPITSEFTITAAPTPTPTPKSKSKYNAPKTGV